MTDHFTEEIVFDCTFEISMIMFGVQLADSEDTLLGHISRLTDCIDENIASISEEDIETINNQVKDALYAHYYNGVISYEYFDVAIRALTGQQERSPAYVPYDYIPKSAPAA